MTVRALSVIGSLFFLSTSIAAQQADTAFRYLIPAPAYPARTGPAVCIDEAHANMHTAAGTYAPFATLLRDDGYDVRSLSANWSTALLQQCSVIIIANATGPTNVRDRSLPHAPAFSKPDLDTLVAWISGGGSLLLIADHAPWPGAVSDLGLILGTEMLDAYAAPGDSGAVIAIFGSPQLPDSAWRRYAADRGLPYRPIAGAVTNPGSLSSHPILRGRSSDKPIRWVVTFTGHAFLPSARVQPLLVFGPRAFAVIDRPDAATFHVGGWLQAGALEFGKGRAVILGEASMCTAHIGGPRPIRTGINVPEAPDNGQFCLNVVRWLTRVLN